MKIAFASLGNNWKDNPVVRVQFIDQLVVNVGFGSFQLVFQFAFFVYA